MDPAMTDPLPWSDGAKGPHLVPLWNGVHRLPVAGRPLAVTPHPPCCPLGLLEPATSRHARRGTTR